MPLNQDKIMGIIMKELESIEERYDGYKDKLGNAIAEIIQLEREHAVHRTRIQQNINKVFENNGDLLAGNREEEIQ